MARALIVPTPADSRDKVLYPEVIDARIADVESLARWLDYAFVLPGGFRYGFGGIIGLIPGIGDILEALLSIYIVARAVQLGVPRVALARMVVNVGIEALVGAVPILGAAFDTVFKANRRNYRLLRDHLASPRQQTSKDWWFLIVTLALVLLGLSVPIFLLLEILKQFRTA